MRERSFEVAAPVVFVVLCVLSLAVAAVAIRSEGQERGAATNPCAPSGSLVRVAQLPELSGLAASTRTPGRLWAHNDSGEPVIFALDANGKVTGQLQVSGADVDDWEAVAVGPCAGASCIYVGDIGDNDAKRAQITVYRVEEPASASGSAKVRDVLHATYPDGARDAETLLVDRTGGIFIVTKERNGSAIYRFPANASARTAVRLERVGRVREDGGNANDPVTDGSISPDGEWVVLRSNDALTFHRARDLFAGNSREARRVDLKTLGEPQGEAVAFGGRNMLYLAGEGGGGTRPGTFAQVTCSMP